MSTFKSILSIRGSFHPSESLFRRFPFTPKVNSDIRKIMDATGALLGPVQSQGEMSLPMLGTRLCAGFPSPADDFLDSAIDLNRLLVPRPASTYLWRVEGHSMVEVGIHDGDILVVDRSVTPKSGHVVVAVVNGEKSVKRLQLDGKPRLAFANSRLPVYEVPEGAEVEIWGVVTWNLHSQIPSKK